MSPRNNENTKWHKSATIVIDWQLRTSSYNQILNFNLNRLCCRLHDGSDDRTWADLGAGGGGSGTIPVLSKYEL